MKRLAILIGIGLFIITTAAFGLYFYLNQTRTHYTTEVKLNNISAAELVNNETKSKKSINLSNPEISLPYNSSDYEIHYQAAPNYANGVYKIESNQTDITIQPSLDRQELDKRFINKKNDVHTAIKNKYPNFDKVYRIESESLYYDGSWYGAVLHYIGDGIFNRDNTGLVLHETDSGWRVVTDPPLPSLNKPNLKDVPVDLINEINKSLHPN